MPGGAAARTLASEIEACRRCPLGATRAHVVVYRGGADPWVTLVGEAPGAEEDREGRPFVGRSGKRLDAALAVVGLAPGEVGIVNLVKCRPTGNRFHASYAAACRPFLERQLALLRPRLLVTLGARPLAALAPGSPRITACAGLLREGPGPPLFPLLHPAAVLHDPRLRSRWDADLEALRLVVEGRRRQG